MAFSKKKHTSIGLAGLLFPNLFLWSAALFSFRISIFSFNQQIRGLNTFGFLFWFFSTLLIVLSFNALRRSSYAFTLHKLWDTIFSFLLIIGFFAIFLLSLFLKLPEYFAMVLLGIQFLIFKYISSFHRPGHRVFIEGFIFFYAFMIYVFLDVGIVMVRGYDFTNDMYREKILLLAMFFSLTLMFLIWLYRLITLGLNYILRGKRYFYFIWAITVAIYLYFIVLSTWVQQRYFLGFYIFMLLMMPLFFVLIFPTKPITKTILILQVSFHCLILPYIAFFEV